MVNPFFNRIDLRKEIELLRDSIGFNWASLRAVKLDENCIECAKAVGPQYDQPSPGCKTCLGTGHPYVDKIVKIYRYLSTSGFDHNSPVGNLNTRVDKCYLEHDDKPKESDYILELEMDSTNNPIQPFNVVRVFQIEDSHPNRGKDGRIEFWTCTIEESNLDLGKTIL